MTRTSTTATPFREHVATGHRPANGGEQYRFHFANGFGASVVRGPYTYGGPDGLWELAVLDGAGHLTYDTEITNDVLGYLTEDEIADTLDRIAALEAQS